MTSPKTEMSTAGSDSEQDGTPDRGVAAPPRRRRSMAWGRGWGRAALPALVMLLAVTVGLLKWQQAEARATTAAREQAVQAATEHTIAMLSYRAATVDDELHAASQRLTGAFRDSYTALVDEVVVPGARQQNISAVATVPAAAALAATPRHAEVLVLVNQTTTVGDEPPTDSASSVKVTLERVGSAWLISEFTPI